MPIRRVPVKEDTQWRSYTTPPHVKAYVFARDGYACRYCGASGDGVTLEADHVNPLRVYGLNVCWNIVAACRPCNRRKSGHTMECWLEYQRTGLSCAYRWDYRQCR